MESPYHGQTLPNLNGFGGSKQRFLRGSTDSGAIGGEDAHVLTVEEMPSHNHLLSISQVAGNVPAVDTGLFPTSTGRFFPTEPTGGSAAHENRPSFYEVVWIMKIK